ncbi:hypothetical protein JP74_09025 [Devosia sp. 17-2-E-8]|nr:hypothetical protein JP74_09025 [Devosia sp. 17-2-E-8]
MTETAPTDIANWPAPNLQPHPFAAIFRMLDDGELGELAERIAANGLREPIVIYEGMILDGRNRFLACLKAGVFGIDVDWRADPHFVAFGGMGWDAERGTDPLEFVWDTNAARRHDSPAQRSMAAARYANARQGQRTDLVEEEAEPSANLRPVVTQAEAAEKLGVSERSVSSAEAVIKHGAPELVDAVDKGLLAVSTAAEVAALPVDEQKEIVAAGDKKAVREAAKKATEKPEDIPVPQHVIGTIGLAFGDVVSVQVGGFGKYGEGTVNVRMNADRTYSMRLSYSYRLGSYGGFHTPFGGAFATVLDAWAAGANSIVKGSRRIIRYTDSVTTDKQRAVARKVVAWIEEWAQAWGFEIEPDIAPAPTPAEAAPTEEHAVAPAEGHPAPSERFMPKQGRPYVLFFSALMEIADFAPESTIDIHTIFRLGQKLDLLDEQTNVRAFVDRHLADLAASEDEIGSLVEDVRGISDPADEPAIDDGGKEPAPLTEALATEDADLRIRAGYEAGEGVAAIAEAIGRPGNKAYVRNRARVMGISSRERQRQMASAFTTAQNAARRAGAQE